MIENLSQCDDCKPRAQLESFMQISSSFETVDFCHGKSEMKDIVLSRLQGFSIIQKC